MKYLIAFLLTMPTMSLEAQDKALLRSDLYKVESYLFFETDRLVPYSEKLNKNKYHFFKGNTCIDCNEESGSDPCVTDWKERMRYLNGVLVTQGSMFSNTSFLTKDGTLLFLQTKDLF